MPRKKTEPEVLQEEVLQPENSNPEMPIEELPAEQPALEPQTEEAFKEEPAAETPVLSYGEEKEEAAEETPAEAAEPEKKSFYDLDFRALDQDLSPEQRQEWNTIYASFRSRSVMRGTIIGVDPHTMTVRSAQTGTVETKRMYCAVIVPFRVRILIPETEMWAEKEERPAFVLRNMAGAQVDFVVTHVDRKAGALVISVKEAVPNPFDEASLRHPVGCRRRASIAGKYAGGVFCNLPDGAVILCRYSFHYEDSDFKTGDTVMVVIQRYDEGKKQIFGKIVGR